uniref:Uncharacterized protein n=1 Tax=Amphora coffeiformis TaxID=265554 RepID=A0A7S3L177_9STRA
MSIFNDTDTSYRTPYEPPPAASRMAGVRFGNTRDVIVLWSGESDEISEYVRGLLFIAVVTFVIFVTWGLLLCIFMCLGRDRVGALSGRPFEREAPLEERNNSKKQDDDEATKNRKDLYKSGDAWNSMATRSRIVFLFSGLVVITFSILLATRGLTELQTTVDTVHDSSVVVQKITEEGREIINTGLRDLRSRAASVRITLLNELNRDIFCPGDPSLENSDIGLEVRKHVDSAMELLEELENFQDGRLADFDEALLSVEDAADSVEQTSDETDLLGWKSMILLIPYTVIAALLMSATVMAFFDVSFPVLDILINFLLLPTFIVMTSGACVLASLTAIVAAVNSDFCLPGGNETASPDENVVGIMFAEGYVEDDFELQMVRYFAEQCTSDTNPFAPLISYVPEMRDNQLALNEVVKILRDEDQLAELSLYCNREFTALDAQIDNMNVILTVLIDSLTRLLDLVSCQRIIPIYTDTIYDAACDYSTKAMFWIFCCAIVLGTFGLIMITLRASFKLSVDAKPETAPVSASPKKKSDEDRGLKEHGSPASPVQATPYAAVHPPEEAPPGEIRVNPNDDDVYTSYTGHVSTESTPFPREYVPPLTRGTHYMDDNTVVREKKASAVDVD